MFRKMLVAAVLGLTRGNPSELWVIRQHPIGEHHVILAHRRMHRDFCSSCIKHSRFSSVFRFCSSIKHIRSGLLRSIKKSTIPNTNTLHHDHVYRPPLRRGPGQHIAQLRLSEHRSHHSAASHEHGFEEEDPCVPKEVCKGRQKVVIYGSKYLTQAAVAAAIACTSSSPAPLVDNNTTYANMSSQTSQLIWGYCRKFFGPAWTYDMIIEEFKFKRSNLACRLQVHKFFRGNVPQTEAEMHAWFQARGCRAPRASASATRAAPKQLLMAPPKPQQQQQPTGEAMAPTFEWRNRPTEANPAKQPAPFALTGSL